MTSALGSAKARKQSMAVSGLLRVEKKEAGTKTGQKEQAPEAFPQRQSQLFFLRLSSAGNHTVHLLLLWASSYTFFLEL